MKMGIVAVQRLEDFIKSYRKYDILLWDRCRPGPGGGSYEAHHQGTFKMLGLVLSVCIITWHFTDNNLNIQTKIGITVSYSYSGS